MRGLELTEGLPDGHVFVPSLLRLGLGLGELGVGSVDLVLGCLVLGDLSVHGVIGVPIVDHGLQLLGHLQREVIKENSLGVSLGEGEPKRSNQYRKMSSTIGKKGLPQ